MTEPALHPASPLHVIGVTIAMYLVLLLLVRVMGPRSLSTMAPTDLACVVAVGAVVGRTTLLAVPTLETGAVALAVLFGMQLLLSTLRRNRFLGSVLSPPPLVLLRDGRLDEEVLSRSRVSHDDLRQRLRLAGVTHLDQVHRVTLERNGQISILRNGTEPDPWLLADLS
ncbi:DUF421 domain-containing protein [Agilicoccus flavus]|uniref:DUF421 domain-containing protein n=1 Tax=Agilicoccus flavus TaxID=2775968 RepID=UPI001CF6455C|nr:YetF domain-containing protein [Agilicoccus flavus]